MASRALRPTKVQWISGFNQSANAQAQIPHGGVGLVPGDDCDSDLGHWHIEDRRNMGSGKCFDVVVLAGGNVLAEFGDRDFPP